MVAYYQHDIAAWMDGTEGLSDGEYRAYHVVCELMYLNNGPIVAHESGIAGRCNQHPLAFRANLKKLIDKGKLRLDAAGKITNPRVEKELVKIRERRRKPPADPPPTSARPPGGRAGVEGRSEGGKTGKSLKNKDQTLFDDSLEKKRTEEIPEATASGAVDQERELYRRGKEVLGSSAGSIITSLLKAKGHDVALARAAIETASTKHNPREWVYGAINAIKSAGSRGGNGPAAALLNLLEEGNR